jgi:hypothetical protein
MDSDVVLPRFKPEPLDLLRGHPLMEKFLSPRLGATLSSSLEPGAAARLVRELSHLDTCAALAGASSY